MQHSRIKNRSVRYVCRGLFSYYIQARSPINGQNRPPEQTKPTKPEEHPPRPKPKPILDTARIPTPEISASRQLPGMKFAISETRPTPLPPIRKPRPPRRPANRIITPAWGPARHTNVLQRDSLLSQSNQQRKLKWLKQEQKLLLKRNNQGGEKYNGKYARVLKR